MRNRKYMALVGIGLALISMQGCLRATTQGFAQKNWFKSANYTYDLSKAAIHQDTVDSSRMVFEIDDWNGYYDQYLHIHQVFPAQDTIPTAEVVTTMKDTLRPCLSNVKDQVTPRRSGIINFGGVLFKAELIDFRFTGEIKDLSKAFCVMDIREQTTMTLQRDSIKIDAPIPNWAKAHKLHNGWTVTVLYPDKVVSTNAPVNDAANKKLVWTDQTFKSQRIQFKIAIPANASITKR